MSGYSIAVLTIVALILLLQFLPWFRARLLRGKPAPDITRELPSVGDDLLIYFWSPRCGACRTMTRIVDSLMARRKDVVKVDASAAPELARKFHVMATPTLVRVHHGRIEEVLIGSRSEEEIRRLLP